MLAPSKEQVVVLIAGKHTRRLLRQPRLPQAHAVGHPRLLRLRAAQHLGCAQPGSLQRQHQAGASGDARHSCVHGRGAEPEAAAWLCWRQRKVNAGAGAASWTSCSSQADRLSCDLAACCCHCTAGCVHAGQHSTVRL